MMTSGTRVSQGRTESPQLPIQALVGEFIATFREFRPRQKPSSSVDQIMEHLQEPQGG